MKLLVTKKGTRLARKAKSCMALNRVELEMAKMRQVDLPLVHRFTPGLYIREIFMPRGTIATTKIHKTEHPFVISKGEVSVWSEGSGWIRLKAPHTGITQPGTRRLIVVHEDTIWITFHATHETDLKKIEAIVIEPHDIPLPSLQQISNDSEQLMRLLQ